MRMGHGAARAVRYFRILYVEACLGKQLDVSRVIVVHVRDDDILHVLHLHTDGGEPLGDGAQERSPAPRRGGGIKAGVDDDGALVSLDHPHVVVQRHGLRMIIAAQKIQITAPLQMAVADSVDAMAHVCRLGGGEKAAIHMQDVTADERCRIA